MSRAVIALILATVCSVAATCSTAADPSQTGRQSRAAQQEPRVYGSQFMTPQERLDYQQRLHSARNQEEWDQIRWQHHQLMRARAWQRGYILPPEPPMWPNSGGYGPGCCPDFDQGWGGVPVLPQSYVDGPGPGVGPWMMPLPDLPAPWRYPRGYMQTPPVGVSPPPALEERTFEDSGEDSGHEEEHGR